MILPNQCSATNQHSESAAVLKVHSFEIISLQNSSLHFIVGTHDPEVVVFFHGCDYCRILAMWLLLLLVISLSRIQARTPASDIDWSIDFDTKQLSKVSIPALKKFAAVTKADLKNIYGSSSKGKTSNDIDQYVDKVADQLRNILVEKEDLMDYRLNVISTSAPNVYSGATWLADYNKKPWKADKDVVFREAYSPDDLYRKVLADTNQTLEVITKAVMGISYGQALRASDPYVKCMRGKGEAIGAYYVQNLVKKNELRKFLLESKASLSCLKPVGGLDGYLRSSPYLGQIYAHQFYQDPGNLKRMLNSILGPDLAKNFSVLLDPENRTPATYGFFEHNDDRTSALLKKLGFLEEQRQKATEAIRKNLEPLHGLVESYNNQANKAYIDYQKNVQLEASLELLMAELAKPPKKATPVQLGFGF